ncbi:unnamed protein product [Cylicostephanus goldi]|uniref:Uncharacterized protein n=1 Tax=Cylicostephanus goldi TaxID=71465 RepID=A0A3P7QA59_CYLGO|nr:unnamed protein product [Cylicostephanus goldi]
MGSALCGPRRKKQVGSSWVGNENENPFETVLTKKERTLLRETFQRLDEPKEIVGTIFVDIVNDIEPDLKKVRRRQFSCSILQQKDYIIQNSKFFILFPGYIL